MSELPPESFTLLLQQSRSGESAALEAEAGTVEKEVGLEVEITAQGDADAADEFLVGQ